MDYLVTFEDGSEIHLSHHGVKGMKWGVWNSETAARYSGGSGHRSIMRANKKVNKNFEAFDNASRRYGNNSYQARAAKKKLSDSVEKREFRVEKHHPGEGKISTSRYNELRSNQRVIRSTITGGLLAGPWGAVPMATVSSSLANRGKRTVVDAIRGRETYRVDPNTGRYENVAPWSSDKNRRSATVPVHVTSEEPKWKQNGYSSEAEHRAAIERAKKIYGGIGYYD